MADGSEETVRWLNELPYKLRRELAKKLQDIANGVVDDIRAAAPVGPTGHLKESVRAQRVRNSLMVVVEAGGALTTKAFVGIHHTKGRGYLDRSEGGKPTTDDFVLSRSYDYALAVEYGNSHVNAHPFFFSTYRAKRADIERQLNEAVGEVVSKL